MALASGVGLISGLDFNDIITRLGGHPRDRHPDGEEYPDDSARGVRATHRAIERSARIAF